MEATVEGAGTMFKRELQTAAPALGRSKVEGGRRTEGVSSTEVVTRCFKLFILLKGDDVDGDGDDVNDLRMKYLS